MSQTSLKKSILILQKEGRLLDQAQETSIIIQNVVRLWQSKKSIVQKILL